MARKVPKQQPWGFDLAKKFRDEARWHLMGITGTQPPGADPYGNGAAYNTSPMNPMGTRNSFFMDPLGMSSNSARGLIGMNLRTGVSPTEADVDRFIANMGGNPHLDGRQARYENQLDPEMVGRQSGGGVRSGKTGSGGPAGWTTGDPLLDALLAQAEMERSRANAVNDQRERNVDDIYRERERQADTELSAMRDRVMGEVDNWGNVQSALNEERSQSTRGANRANLAARGLDMSDIESSFNTRADRDLALTQQDLSERKSARKADYDSRLTSQLAQMRAQLAGDRAAFQERPTDQGPDMGQIMQLAMQYGLGNRGQGFGAAGGAAGYGYGAPRQPMAMRGIGGPAQIDLFGFGGQGGQSPQGVPAPIQGGQEFGGFPEMGPPAPSRGELKKMRRQADLQQRVAARRAAGYQRPQFGGITPQRAGTITGENILRALNFR